MDEHTPVVIVGASVAGLFAARLLAEARVPVDVYERTEHLEPRARTLIVTPELRRVLGFPPVSATLNNVHTLELCTGRRSVPITLREPDLIVERAALIRVLADQAERAGARLTFGHDFIGVARDGARTVVEFRRRGTDARSCVPARAIIAADGVRSHVARNVGLRERPAVTVLQARVATPRSSDAGVGKVWFLPRETQYFYWLCPESAEVASVGLVDTNPRKARAKLDQFLADRGMTPLEYQSALVPLYTPNPPPMKRVHNTDVMFVGDAAGQVKVTTIGGSVSGLLGARAAARSLADRTSYSSELRGLERELRLHWRIRTLMNCFREHEYDMLLQLLGGKVGRLLAIHNRDRMTAGLWPIVAVQPRLPLLAAQVMLRVSFRP